MNEEFDDSDFQNFEEPEEYRPVTIEGLIRVVSILFVLGIYIVIFLKIMFLD
jgi:hypothetical protein